MIDAKAAVEQGEDAPNFQLGHFCESAIPLITSSTCICNIVRIYTRIGLFTNK
jgi:hypothetical protein